MVATRVNTSTKRFFLCSYIVVIFAFAKANSQTITSQGSSTILLNNGIAHLDVFLEEHVELHIITTKEQGFRISENQYGEYQQAILLSKVQRNDTLFISDPQNPTFKYPNNKLSAHKVVDGIATIYIPEGKTVFITANSADVTLTGHFKNIVINLQNGKCNLDKTTGDFQIVTVYAPVMVRVINTQIYATSKNGSVTGFKNIKNIVYTGKIESINGTITIL